MISIGAKLEVREGKIKIGSNCVITFGCIIVSHDYTAKLLHPGDYSAGEIVIEDNVYIGVGPVILKNVNIGRGSIIAAGSVITEDVPPNTLVIYNRKQVIKNLESYMPK